MSKATADNLARLANKQIAELNPGTPCSTRENVPVLRCPLGFAWGETEPPKAVARPTQIGHVVGTQDRDVVEVDNALDSIVANNDVVANMFVVRA